MRASHAKYFEFRFSDSNFQLTSSARSSPAALIESAHHPLAFPRLRVVPRDGARVRILLRLLLVTGRAACGAEDDKGGGKDSVAVSYGAISAVSSPPQYRTHQISSLGRYAIAGLDADARGPANRDDIRHGSGGLDRGDADLADLAAAALEDHLGVGHGALAVADAQDHEIPALIDGQTSPSRPLRTVPFL